MQCILCFYFYGDFFKLIFPVVTSDAPLLALLFSFFFSWRSSFCPLIQMSPAMSLPRFHIIILMLFSVVFKGPHTQPYQYFSICAVIVHLCLFLLSKLLDGSEYISIYSTKVYNVFTLSQELFWMLVIK